MTDGPIAGAAADVRRWLADALRTDVVAGPPGLEPTDAAAATVGFTLLGLDAQPEVGAQRGRAPLRMRARFVVWVDGPEPEALALLDGVVSAIDRRPDALLHLPGPDPEWWLALGRPSRPSVVVDVPARFVRAATEPPLVQSPLAVDAHLAWPLSGRVVGPGDVGLVGARVELLATGAVSRTGRGGAFEFPLVPAGLPELRFRILARGQELLASVEPDPGDQTVIIRCDLAALTTPEV